MKPRVWKGKARSSENYDTNKETNQEKLCSLVPSTSPCKGQYFNTVSQVYTQLSQDGYISIKGV